MRDEPLAASRFAVEVDGAPWPCSAVLGLALEAGRETVGPVTLRRAAGADDAFRAWTRSPEPRTVAVALLDGAGEPVCRYLLRRARPVRWTGPELDAGSTGLATEDLALVADALDLEAGTR